MRSRLDGDKGVGKAYDTAHGDGSQSGDGVPSPADQLHWYGGALKPGVQKYDDDDGDGPT